MENQKSKTKIIKDLVRSPEVERRSQNVYKYTHINKYEILEPQSTYYYVPPPELWEISMQR